MGYSDSRKIKAIITGCYEVTLLETPQGKYLVHIVQNEKERTTKAFTDLGFAMSVFEVVINEMEVANG